MLLQMQSAPGDRDCEGCWHSVCLAAGFSLPLNQENCVYQHPDVNLLKFPSPLQGFMDLNQSLIQRWVSQADFLAPDGEASHHETGQAPPTCIKVTSGHLMFPRFARANASQALLCLRGKDKGNTVVLRQFWALERVGKALRSSSPISVNQMYLLSNDKQCVIRY